MVVTAYFERASRKGSKTPAHTAKVFFALNARNSLLEESSRPIAGMGNCAGKPSVINASGPARVSGARPAGAQKAHPRLRAIQGGSQEAIVDALSAKLPAAASKGSQQVIELVQAGLCSLSLVKIPKALGLTSMLCQTAGFLP